VLRRIVRSARHAAEAVAAPFVHSGVEARWALAVLGNVLLISASLGASVLLERMAGGNPARPRVAEAFAGLSALAALLSVVYAVRFFRAWGKVGAGAVMVPLYAAGVVCVQAVLTYQIAFVARHHALPALGI
jgi:hypothetical protein